MAKFSSVPLYDILLPPLDSPDSMEGPITCYVFLFYVHCTEGLTRKPGMVSAGINSKLPSCFGLL